MCAEYEIKPTIFNETLKLSKYLDYFQNQDAVPLKVTVQKMLTSWLKVLSHWHPRNQNIALAQYIRKLSTCFDLADALATPESLEQVIICKLQLTKLLNLTDRLLDKTQAAPNSKTALKCMSTYARAS